MIDANEVVLFRRKDDQTEYAIPIKGNEKAMKKFICIPSKSLDDLVEDDFGLTD